MRIVSHTDPISFGPGKEAYSYQDQSAENSLTVHFESEENKQAFLEIPVEPSVSDLSNPTEEWVDEG